MPLIMVHIVIFTNKSSVLIIYLRKRKTKFDAPIPLDMSSIRQKRDDVVGINFIRQLELSIKKRNVHCVHKRSVVFHVFLIDNKIRQKVTNRNISS